MLIPIFSWIVYAIAREQMEGFLALPLASVESGYALITSALMRLFWKAAGLFLIFGAVDLLRQFQHYRQDLRMSKQDIKDESRSMDGDPQVKGRRRQLARKMIMQRMHRDVPKADVVITNPTHYAVALGFDFGTMEAPKVLAKGRNLLAEEIKAEARWAGVPVIENPPLARSLYRVVEIGQSIPVDLYQAVASILAWLYKQRVEQELREKKHREAQAKAARAEAQQAAQTARAVREMGAIRNMDRNTDRELPGREMR